MKWKNLDIGPGYYHITATVTAWLPLLRRADVRKLICEEIATALAGCRGSLTAFVIMPDHLHLVIHLPGQGLLHAFNRLWRGRSARRAIDLLKSGSASELTVMAAHANADCRYAFWKEQVRCFPIVTQWKLVELLAYVHGNPVRRGLSQGPGDWPLSSFRFYDCGEEALMPVTPPRP
jgi:REP element-mobilizing transposase RayT